MEEKKKECEKKKAKNLRNRRNKKIIDLTHYDDAFISFNNERYMKVFFHNGESRLYMFYSQDDYRIYGLTIRQIS